MVNISELLKDVPKGMKLYSPLFGKVTLEFVVPCDHITVKTEFGKTVMFNHYGVYFTGYSGSECLLFPSKDCRTWEGWKLPVVPKFKVGDWIVRSNGSSDVPIQIYNLKKDRYLVTNMLGSKGELMINRQDEWHLWTIEDAIDGDVLAAGDWVCIFRNFHTNGFPKCHCHYDLTLDKFKVDTDSYMACGVDIYPATREQRDLLFAKMKEAGYTWSEKKKELKKIQSHYDIAKFYAGMPVLVRDDYNEEWHYLLFSHCRKKVTDHFFAGGSPWFQCIPFNEETEHLLGTSDMPSEEFINW